MIILNLCARRGQCSSSTHNVNGPIFGSAPYHYYTLPIQYKMMPFVHFLFGLLFCNFFLAIIHITALQYSVGSYGERTELRNFHSFKRLYCSSNLHSCQNYHADMQIPLSIFDKQNDKQFSTIFLSYHVNMRQKKD